MPTRAIPWPQTAESYRDRGASGFEQLRELLSTYLKPEDIERVAAAYLFSAEAHHGQFRISGEPYISHPLAVAGILAGWHLDPQALIAALLHDVMEDTGSPQGDRREVRQGYGRSG